MVSSRPCNLKFFVTDHQCTLVYSKTSSAEEQDPTVLPRARRCEGVTLLSRNGIEAAFRPAHLYRSGSWFNLFHPHHIVNEHNTQFFNKLNNPTILSNLVRPLTGTKPFFSQISSLLSNLPAGRQGTIFNTFGSKINPFISQFSYLLSKKQSMTL